MTSHQYIKEEIPLLISSNENLDIYNKSPDGSAFKVRLEDGLHIPKEARNINLRVEEASIWYTTPNIISGVNDRFDITGPDQANGLIQNYLITLEQGLYSVDNLIVALENELISAGAKYIDNGVKKPLIQFIPDTATGKLLLQINYDSVIVDFNTQRTFRDILGWDARTLGPYTGQTMPLILRPPNPAKFNQIDYYLINSSIIEQGLRVNSTYNHTIARVLIDVEPGSQIVYRPNHPTRVNADNLRGVRKSEVEFWLTSDKYERVNTNGEDWTASIVIEYYIPIKNEL